MYNNPYMVYQPRVPSNNQYQQSMQPMIQPSITPTIQANNQTLLGKYVDSIEMVKASEIPLDGSIVYFPFTDGSAIVSKQLQVDGTTKTIIYKQSIETEIEQPKYITLEDVKKEISNIDFSDIDDLKEDIRDIKKQLKEMKKKGE